MMVCSLRVITGVVSTMRVQALDYFIALTMLVAMQLMSTLRSVLCVFFLQMLSFSFTLITLNHNWKSVSILEKNYLC